MSGDKLQKIQELQKMYDETVYGDLYISDEVNDEGYSYQTVGPFDVSGEERPHYEDTIAQFFNDDYPGYGPLFVEVIKNLPVFIKDLQTHYSNVNELKPLTDILAEIKRRSDDITTIALSEKNDLNFNHVWQFADDLKDYSDDLKTLIEGYYGKFDR